VKLELTPTIDNKTTIKINNTAPLKARASNLSQTIKAKLENGNCNIDQLEPQE